MILDESNGRGIERCEILMMDWRNLGYGLRTKKDNALLIMFELNGLKSVVSCEVIPRETVLFEQMGRYSIVDGVLLA